MPKDTFFQLPDEKRHRFVEAALDEFCDHPYDQASITRIVARLGIAKGSVYQYFEDKLDLFSYLIQASGQRKLEVVGADPPSGTFFQRLRQMYKAGLLFLREEPRWARVGMRLLESSQDPRVEQLRRSHLAAALGWMRGELRAAQAVGEVDATLDPDAVAPFVLSVLQDGLLRSFLLAAGVDRIDAAAIDPLLKVPLADLERIADTAVVFLERGVGGSRDQPAI